MARIYEIEYKFFDEMDDKHSKWRSGKLCVLDPNKISDKLIKEFLNRDEFKQADKLLLKNYGLKDDDIAFYHYSTDNLVEMVVELQKDFDIIINEIKEIL